MDNDDKFVGHIYSRREAFRIAGAAGFAFLVGGAKAQVTTPQTGGKPDVNLVATPEVEEGPFFVDEGLNRKDVTEGTTRASVTKGLPLYLKFTVYELSKGVGRPLKGAMVDIWHADAAGTYSDEANGSIQGEDTRGQKWLRGYQVTDAKGVAEFKTIYPGWYPSRTIHIHVKVRVPATKGNPAYNFVTQVFFDEKTNDAVLVKAPYNSRGQRRVRNDNDGLFASKQADGTSVGSHLMLDLSDAKDGAGKAGAYAIAFDMDGV